METNIVKKREPPFKSLIGKTVYISRMTEEGSAAMAAFYRAVGVNGMLIPEPTPYTLELARKYTNGDECYPEIVTLGGFLKVIEDQDFEPSKTAFFMPSASGPCRFGQYKVLLEKILEEKGLEEVLVLAPDCENGYDNIGEGSKKFFRLAWWALVCSDALRKLLLQTRPYENNVGETDRIHQECLKLLCDTIEQSHSQMNQKLKNLVRVMEKIESKFSKIPATYTKDKPLIGIVGEIYCRLDNFANANLIRRIEKFGGEVWLASVAEWVYYTNFMHRYNMRKFCERFSKSMLGAIVKNKIQMLDEHKLLAPLKNRFYGYEEPENIEIILKPAEPYLPFWGAFGEMVLNVGGAIYFQNKGADGIIDISPFSCMNGIVCEAIYPKISKDFTGIPIRNFYFDGTEANYDGDIEIFIELVKTYQRRKNKIRVYPYHFNGN
jgi:predicted nucleotide-binding protein (sugar kinase/HSP70/actin superfamily)